MRQIVPFLSLFSIVILSCNTGAQQKFQFFYYPSRNVYYDVSNNLYLYSLDGGKTWDSLNIDVNREPAIPGSKETVYSASHQVWLNNKQHLQQFNGHALNIMHNDSSSDKDLVAERKIKTSKPVEQDPSTEKKEPEKKPGFFKRLFGKKN